MSTLGVWTAQLDTRNSRMKYLVWWLVSALCVHSESLLWVDSGSLDSQLGPPNPKIEYPAWWLRAFSRCELSVFIPGFWIGSLTPPVQEVNIMCGGWVRTLGALGRWTGSLAPPQFKCHMSCVAVGCVLWVSTLGCYFWRLDWQLDPPNARINYHVWWLGAHARFLF